MQTKPKKPAAAQVPLKAAEAAPLDLATASIPDALAKLRVNPEIGLTSSEGAVRTIAEARKLDPSAKCSRFSLTPWFPASL